MKKEKPTNEVGRGKRLGRDETVIFTKLIGAKEKGGGAIDILRATIVTPSSFVHLWKKMSKEVRTFGCG